MLAKLHGKDFKIEAAGPDERLVLEGRTAEWTWYVFLSHWSSERESCSALNFSLSSPVLKSVYPH